MRRTLRPSRAGAVLAAAGLLAAACGSSTTAPKSTAPTAGQSSSPGSAPAAGWVLGCMVAGTGGIDDRPFNAPSWQGMQEAQAAEPGKVAVTYLQSMTESDYVPNINTFIGRKCGITPPSGS
ncbi:MAG TPA: hypothetical protein VKV80_06675 [Streptosporangiaceae bacterium]|nr:hypothetical protein [Streptosporangiaceae bacterium]